VIFEVFWCILAGISGCLFVVVIWCLVFVVV